MKKRIIALALLVASISGSQMIAIQIKNNLRYGVAVSDADGARIANICTMDTVNCEIRGKVTRSGVELTRDQMRVRLNVNGIDIYPGETKEVGFWGDGSRLTAYYDTTVLQFTAPVQNSLEFPRDFKLAR